ncbi:Elongator complex protein 4 [Hibiscus syriacus]|uniref:Elongator complex protein 4 n=1 Tax=Hibiscus syriacus TaxID=106335 RepID=A0A6A2ZC98_HIBSY|nr:Elongator complex protein 4 [Hibiscus syriacus]
MASSLYSSMIPMIYLDSLPKGSHLLDKAKTEGETEDDGEDEDEYEDDDGNRDEDGDNEEEEELTKRNRLKRRSFSLKRQRQHFLKVRLQGSQGKPKFKNQESLRSQYCLAFCFLTLPTAMATAKIRSSSFSRNLSTAAPSVGPILIGNGFLLGSLVMVMEDAEAPQHMLLLRNFMTRGLVHGQHLLYASPVRDPRGVLGTLPSPAVSKYDKSREPDPNQEKGMRIAWQYKKYFSENQLTFDGQRDGKREYSNEFDLRKPLERHLINGQCIDCVSIHDFSDLFTLHD